MDYGFLTYHSWSFDWLMALVSVLRDRRFDDSKNFFSISVANDRINQFKKDTVRPFSFITSSLQESEAAVEPSLTPRTSYTMDTTLKPSQKSTFTAQDPDKANHTRPPLAPDPRRPRSP